MGITQQSQSKGIYNSLFPCGFSKKVLLLILEAWEQLQLPACVTQETPITALLKKKLREINDYDEVIFISSEDPIDDPIYGTELGRNDLRFYPKYHNRQETFYVIECKRLHTPHGTLINEYIQSGIMRFLTDEAKQYARNQHSGAMLGYVLDGDTASAFDSLCAAIDKNKSTLNLIDENAFRTPSACLKNYPFSADTTHLREGTPFSLHHLLVAVRTANL